MGESWDLTTHGGFLKLMLGRFIVTCATVQCQADHSSEKSPRHRKTTTIGTRKWNAENAFDEEMRDEHLRERFDKFENRAGLVELRGEMTTAVISKSTEQQGDIELDELKCNVRIPGLFASRIPLQKAGKVYAAKCPFHPDDTPSFSLYQHDGVWLYKCLGGTCRETGNVFQFIQHIDQISFIEAVEVVKEYLGVERGTTVDPEEKRIKSVYKYDKAATIARISEAEDYLKAHGVSPVVARAHDVGVDTFPGLGSCITFPYDDRNVKLRGLHRKEFRHYSGTSTANLFYNLGTIERDRPEEILVVESERDCLTLESHGFHAISVSSASACINSNGSLKFKAEDLEKFGLVQGIYLALDQDAAGRECAEGLHEALPWSRILTWEYRGKDSGDPKDIGEMYEGDPAAFKEKVEQLVRRSEARMPEEYDAGEEEVLKAEIAQSIEKADVDALSEMETFQRTDAGNAERLVAKHGKNIRYLNDKRSWRIYDGVRWNLDTTSEIARLAKDTIRRILDEAAQTTDRDHDLRKDLTKWSIGCESRSRLDNMVALAAREEEVSTNSSDFDQNPWLFNCANGTIDLENNIFRPARREDLLSKRSPVFYDPKALCPRFDAFLAEILPSPLTRRFLQASLGYTLSGHGWEEYVWFLIGEKGANGKTTLIETVRHVFGEDDYGLNMNFNSLLPRDGQGPTPDLARLRGVRFASASESDQGQRLSTAMLKRLTSRDRMTAANKYENETEFTQTHKLWLATNFPPEISSVDDAMWRRIARVPFNYSVPPDQQDSKLLEKLKGEGPGILNWMFEGWKIYQAEDGLEVPEEVKGATELYREVLDVVKDFLNECVVSDAGDIGSTKLYLAFKAWFAMSHNQRQQPMSQRMFSTRLEKLGFNIDKRRDGNVISGVGHLIGDQGSEPDPF